MSSGTSDGSVFIGPYKQDAGLSQDEHFPFENAKREAQVSFEKLILMEIRDNDRNYGLRPADYIPWIGFANYLRRNSLLDPRAESRANFLTCYNAILTFGAVSGTIFRAEIVSGIESLLK